MEELLHESRRSRVVRLPQRGGGYILKILNRDLPPPEELARFRQEYAMTLSLVDIAGVIRCHGLIRHQESLALQLEDIGGDSLDRILADNPLTLEQFFDMAPRFVDILAEVHAAGVVHRDINPSNLIWNTATGALRLIDFGIADRLPEELAEARPPSLLEGTLAFLSPEQSGRMNRPVDLRSDLYAVGATFYALLSGQPPFVSPDPLRLIADHLAKIPEPLQRRCPHMPETLSRIVSKLLAKEPGARYQSAVGLAVDLRRCQAQWAADRSVSLFPLGQDERVAVLRFSARLHGREKELKTLFGSLEQVLEGGRRLVLLTGGPGTGKSALGRELRRPVSGAQGRFAGGKFDQLRRDRPMAAMMEALSDLLRQRQADPSRLFDAWRESVCQELGNSVAVLTQQLPEMAALFPDVPAAVVLPPAQAAIRFRQAVIGLLCTLGDAGRPLVLFLDDLQWADLPFIELLGEMLAAPRLERVLVVGAYRDNEVSAAHPLALAVTQWETDGLSLRRLPVLPLPRQATLSWLADSLACAPDTVAPLSAWLQEMSVGNPFHLRALLTEYHDRGGLFFGNDGWSWSLERIQSWQVSNSVVDLLLERFGRLRESSLRLLATAACLGHAFDLATLAAAAGGVPHVVAEETEWLLNAGFWLPARGERRLARWLEGQHSDVGYRFVHDRVQEAALALITPNRKERFRLELGRRLLQAFPDCADNDHLFLVAEQFVGLAPRLLDDKTRPKVARVLLAAGRRAKGAIAFSIALAYLEAGMAVLGREGWQDDFAVSLALRHEAAECAGALIDLERVERLWTEVTQQTANVRDHLPVLACLAPLYIARFLVDKMRRLGVTVLRHLDLPEAPTRTLTARQGRAVRQALVEALAGQDAESLAALPVHEETETHTLARLLLSIFIGLFFSDPSLLFYYTANVILRMLKEGKRLEDAGWYCTWVGACLMGSGRLEEVESGRRLGQAAGLLLERDPRYTPPVIPDDYLHIVFVGTWLEPWGRNCSRLLELYPVAVARGDNGCAGFAVGAHLDMRIQLGEPLSHYHTLVQEWSPRLEQTGIVNLRMEVDEIFLPQTRELMGTGDSHWRTRAPLPEISGDINALLFLQEGAGRTALFLREYATALQHLRQAYDLADRMGGHGLYLPSLATQISLVMIALLPGSDKATYRRSMRQLARYREQLAVWSRLNPANFLHLERLVAAAWHCVMGHPEQALPLCEEAVASIRAQSGEVWLQYEALALEVAGEALLALRCDDLARHMLCRAVRTWSRYGADRVVQEREQHHGRLVQGWNSRMEERLSAAASGTSDRQDSVLLVDYPSLLQASHSIASERSFDEVVRRLLSLTLSNAGAERARLFLTQQGEWLMACEGSYQSGEILLHGDHGPDADQPAAWLELVRYVARSRSSVVLDDVSSDERWSHLSVVPCSVLCTPLLHVGAVMGVLLLEHGHSTGVFTRERLETVAILGAQAVISLTNARVMEELQAHLQQIRRLGAHLDTVSEAEKRRLASEVHDALGNTLTVAKISLSILGKRQREAEDRQRCQEIYQLTEEALRSVRRISHALRPDVLDRLGLRAALEELLYSTRSHAGFACRLEAAEKEWPLDEARRTALFRIAQESVTNVIRHAGASAVVIAVREEQECIVLEIRDDGRGIPAEKATHIGSFGLAGMRERAERLGGELHVAQQETGGTRVTARVPWTME
ncbi:MAG: AAA family ATPase [Magnetococcales bacterium]|nr:AAA family ATPase [Magnetococcales bacterium]